MLTTDLAGVEAFAVSAGLLALLTTAAERRPVLVLVDDVQWLDDPTRDALGFVAPAAPRGQRRGRPCGAARRPAESSDASWRGSSRSPRSTTPPRWRSSRRGRHRSTRAARPALLKAAHGNPLARLEFPQRLSVEQREGREPLPPALVAGELVESAFAEAAGRPSHSSRTALALAALLDEDGVEVFETAAARLDSRSPTSSPQR